MGGIPLIDLSEGVPVPMAIRVGSTSNLAGGTEDTHPNPDTEILYFLVCRWKCWRLGIHKALVPLQTAWNAFSQPVPTSCSELLTQLLLCASLACVIAGLLHHWLVSSQLYPQGPPALVTTVCGLLVFLSLGLVPPIRCLFALSVPTLGSEQGRRLLLSYSVANLAVAVVPNVLANVGAAGQVLCCVTEGSLESLLNTTYQLGLASQALGPASQAGSRSLAFGVQGNSSAFRLHMHMAAQQILEDFSGLEFLTQAALRTQRVVTGLFMLGLLGESAWYLHRYLTDLRFDNIYATRQLVQQLTQAGATHLLASPPPWLLQTAQPKLSHEELLSCLFRLGLLALLLVATAVTAATDYGAFLLAQAAVAWAQKLPTVPVTLTVKYDVSARRGMLSELFRWAESVQSWALAYVCGLESSSLDTPGSHRQMVWRHGEQENRNGTQEGARARCGRRRSAGTAFSSVAPPPTFSPSSHKAFVL